MDKLFIILKTVLRRLGFALILFGSIWLFTFIFYSGPLAFLLLVSGIIGILYKAQDLLVYHPNEPLDARKNVLLPSKYSLPFDNLHIMSGGIPIHIYLIKQKEPKNVPTVVFFHGNAGNMGTRIINAAGIYHHLEVNVLMVEYRGYGLSKGKPSESGLYLDAQAALDYLYNHPDIDNNKIILFGRSLGGAVAIDLASRCEYNSKIWGLIVENTFTSIPDMANVILKWSSLRWIPKLFHKNKYYSLHKIAYVTTPTLIISGSKDNLVPTSMSEELHSKCAAVYKKLVIIEGGGHNDTWTQSGYYSVLKQFVLQLPPLAPKPEVQLEIF